MRRLSILLFAFLSCAFLSAQTALTLAEADQLLIKNNLDLLAAKYDIDIAEAQKVQAKLFDNPSVGFNFPVYSKNGGWLDVKGYYDVSLQQAIQIAGKRKAGINVAESQKQLAVWQYELLAKQLKYAVHQSYFIIYFTEQSLEKTSVQAAKIKTVMDALQAQYKRGNVTLDEVLRVTASYNSLSGDILEMTNTIADEKSALRTLLLLNSDAEIDANPTEGELNKYSLSLLSLQDAIEKAEEQTPEIKTAEANIALSEAQLKYEKKQVIPDLQLGVDYDLSGGYEPYLTTATVGLSIPIFNRNQGNIKAAEYQLKQAQLAKETQKNILDNRIVAAYNRAMAIQESSSKIAPDFESQFDTLIGSVTENYMKRNISLLEFTDLFETYHGQIIQLNTLKLNRILAYEDLDYNTGYTLFK